MDELTQEFIEAIHKIANSEKLKNPSVFEKQEIKMWQVERVLRANKLFWEEYNGMET